MTVGQIWDLAFNSFTVLVGVGLLWLGFVEPVFPSRGLSVALMIILALLAALARFVLGWRYAHRKLREAQAEIEAAYARYEEEVG